MRSLKHVRFEVNAESKWKERDDLLVSMTLSLMSGRQEG